MANPLFDAVSGRSAAVRPDRANHTSTAPNAPVMPSNGPQMTNMQDAMRQLQANPAQMIKQAGFNVPDEIANNPQAAVMHMIQSGQIGGPMMRRIQPMLNMLMGRR